MVLLVDMGNTRLNMAGWEEGGPVFSAETPTDRGWNAGSCAAALAKVLAPFGVVQWDGCALSSVVPALTDAVRQALSDELNVPVSVDPLAQYFGAIGAALWAYKQQV